VAGVVFSFNKHGSSVVRFFSLLFIVFLGILSSSPAQAERISDSLSIGGGGYDFDKVPRSRKSFDYRMEYRWGVSLLPKISDRFNSVEPYFQVHPFLGFEGNTKGAIYPNGGFNLDVPFLHYGILTWSEAVGVFGRGNDACDLGSLLEFRSQIELGLRFKNDLRLTGFISHISNAHVANGDPGAEVVGVYLHMPLSLLRGK
jgi:lipid A 3-O-deacylase